MSTKPVADTPVDARSVELEAAMRLHLVPGIGPVIHGELVRVFGSPKGVLEAAPADVRNVPGVGPKLVQQLSLACLLYTSPSPRDQRGSRMPSSA